MEVRSVVAVVHTLNEADVKYLIVGDIAVNAYGYDSKIQSFVASYAGYDGL